jgi:esterase/lipase
MSHHLQYIPSNNWIDFKPQSSPTSLALLVHGLNNKPEILSEIGALLAQKGILARIVRLRGHDTNSTWPKNLNANDWIKDINAAYFNLVQLYPDKNCINVSYSLGASVVLSAMKKNQRMLFLAPAVSLKSKTIPIRVLSSLDFLGLSLRSFSSPEFRAHDHTSLLAYSALFETVNDSQHVMNYDNIKKTNIKIFIDPDDELISIKKLYSWAKDNELLASITELKRDQPKVDYPAHLIIDKQTLGENAWNTLENELNSF